MPFVHSRYNASCIHLVRSPYAVVASQLRFPTYQDVKTVKDSRSYIKGPLVERLNSLEVISDIRNKEEMLTFWYCIHNAYSLLQAVDRTWHTVHYEDLHTDPMETYLALSEYLNKRNIPLIPFEIYKTGLVKPSATTQSDSPFAVVKSFDPYSWKEELTKIQIESITRILSHFGLADLVSNRWL